MKFGKKKIEFNYFDEFIKNAKYGIDIVKILKEFIANYQFSKVKSETEKIHSIEVLADKNLHKLKDYLLKDFLPPIDREDILTIAHKIDDIVDGIDEIIIDMDILNVTHIKPEMKELINLLEKTINKTYNLIVNFKNLKNIESIKQQAIEVNHFEEQGDRLYEKAVRTLFAEEKNAIEVIKWSKIYESIEDCFDACENVADGIEEVLMKNS